MSKSRYNYFTSSSFSHRRVPKEIERASTLWAGGVQITADKSRGYLFTGILSDEKSAFAWEWSWGQWDRNFSVGQASKCLISCVSLSQFSQTCLAEKCVANIPLNERRMPGAYLQAFSLLVVYCYWTNVVCLMTVHMYDLLFCCSGWWCYSLWSWEHCLTCAPAHGREGGWQFSWWFIVLMCGLGLILELLEAIGLRSLICIKGYH